MSPEQELHIFLQENPQLLELQLQISKDLERLDDPLARTSYVFEIMLDKLQELMVELDKAVKIAEELK